MAERGWTPGPWKVGIGDDPEWPTYRLAEMIDADPNGDEANANARLIAQAALALARGEEADDG